MKIGYFTERPYQSPEVNGVNLGDLDISNEIYDPEIAASLLNRYIDEKIYAEEVGFDMLMLNEHHSTPFQIGGVQNVEASILARATHRAKIVLLGNVLPIWDDPLWLAETLAMIDVISRGRLVSGWVRGTGRESVAHNAQAPYNWERFQEAHEFVMKAWSTPGPFRWEGEHYQYRYVNPGLRPYQQPHPQVWIPGVLSRNTVEWCARNRLPYVMLATRLEPTKKTFDYYSEVAAEHGYEAGTQHRGYLFKVHVDETEDLAYEVGRKYLEGPPNIFLEGSRGEANPVLQNLPGMTSRTDLLPTKDVLDLLRSRGRLNWSDKEFAGAGDRDALHSDDRIEDTPEVLAERERMYQTQLEAGVIISGTPTTVIPKIRHVLETLRPGQIFFWDGDGAMSHEDAMRSLKLMGEEVLPAVREMGDDLGLRDAFEVDPATNGPGVEAMAGTTAD